jgi:hypothetical protein
MFPSQNTAESEVSPTLCHAAGPAPGTASPSIPAELHPEKGVQAVPGSGHGILFFTYLCVLSQVIKLSSFLEFGWV